MGEDDRRSSEARAAAELALVRVVHHYGTKPEFVLLGGLVPQLLCSRSEVRHAGTTDVDVQVDLEIADGSGGAARLEQALLAAGFSPDGEVWRWQTRSSVGSKAVVQFELLADLDDVPAERVVAFDGCKHLGAANVCGTRFASRNVCEMTLTADVGGVGRTVTINVTGVAGFLMAKVGAAKARAKPRDWYDIAFVLLHNDEQVDGADAVRAAFPDVDDFPRTACWTCTPTSPMTPARGRWLTSPKSCSTIQTRMRTPLPLTPCSQLASSAQRCSADRASADGAGGDRVVGCRWMARSASGWVGWIRQTVGAAASGSTPPAE